MKFILTLSFLISLQFLFAKKSFHFPDVSYAYAKVYYFNLGKTKTRPDDYIYSKEDGYAASIIPNGKISSKALTSNIEKLFLYHKNGLLNGLSKCFIPRHGIIYFDKNDQPVASLSICFECEAIRMWTIEKGKIKSTDPNASEGASQLKTLKQFLLKENILISDDPNDYKNLKEDPIMITLNFDKLDSSIVAATYSEIRRWSTTPFRESSDIKYTGGGEKFKFATLHLGENTKFLFYDTSIDSKLAEAYIDSENVTLPNGIHCGSTLEEVMNTFTVYDGPVNPNLIILEDSNHKIVYTFENQILVLITINK